MIIHVKQTKNPFEKIKGLIGARRPEATLIRTRFGIHTLGLKFPIDVVVVDRKGIVHATKHGLKPNRMFLWNPKLDLILELPTGTINEKRIKKGDKLTLVLR